MKKTSQKIRPDQRHLPQTRISNISTALRCLGTLCLIPTLFALLSAVKADTLTFNPDEGTFTTTSGSSAWRGAEIEHLVVWQGSSVYLIYGDLILLSGDVLTATAGSQNGIRLIVAGNCHVAAGARMDVTASGSVGRAGGGAGGVGGAGGAGGARVVTEELFYDFGSVGLPGQRGDNGGLGQVGLNNGREASSGGLGGSGGEIGYQGSRGQQGADAPDAVRTNTAPGVGGTGGNRGGTGGNAPQPGATGGAIAGGAGAVGQTGIGGRVLPAGLIPNFTLVGGNGGSGGGGGGGGGSGGTGGRGGRGGPGSNGLRGMAGGGIATVSGGAGGLGGVLEFTPTANYFGPAGGYGGAGGTGLQGYSGGAGGGALSIEVRGSITVAGSLLANGGAGAFGFSINNPGEVGGAATAGRRNGFPGLDGAPGQASGNASGGAGGVGRPSTQAKGDDGGAGTVGTGLFPAVGGGGGGGGGAGGLSGLSANGAGGGSGRNGGNGGHGAGGTIILRGSVVIGAASVSVADGQGFVISPLSSAEGGRLIVASNTFQIAPETMPNLLAGTKGVRRAVAGREGPNPYFTQQNRTAYLAGVPLVGGIPHTFGVVADTELIPEPTAPPNAIAVVRSIDGSIPLGGPTSDSDGNISYTGIVFQNLTDLPLPVPMFGQGTAIPLAESIGMDDFLGAFLFERELMSQNITTLPPRADWVTLMPGGESRTLTFSAAGYNQTGNLSGAGGEIYLISPRASGSIPAGVVNLLVGQSQAVQFRVRNDNATVPANDLLITSLDAVNGTASGFTDPISLANLAEQDLGINITAAQKGAISVVVNSNDFFDPAKAVPVGQAVAPVRNVTTSNLPSTGSIMLRTGERREGTITVTNTGNGNLSGLGDVSNLRGSVTGTGGSGFTFAFDDGDFSIADGESLLLPILISGETNGSQTMNVIIATENGSANGFNQGTTTTVSRTANFQGPLPELRWTDVEGGKTISHPQQTRNAILQSGTPLTLNLHNLAQPNGQAFRLNVFGVSLDGPHAAEFSVSGFTAGAVNQNSSRQLTVNFNGTTYPRYATLRVETDHLAPDGLGAEGETFIIHLVATDSADGHTFAAWIAGYDVGGNVGFSDDPDQDGIPHGIEAFFGTRPNEFNRGLSDLTMDGNTFTFQHPLNEFKVTNIEAGYQWSTDLTHFHPDGETDDNGTRVTFTPGEIRDGMLTVNGVITGDLPTRIFIRLMCNLVSP